MKCNPYLCYNTSICHFNQAQNYGKNLIFNKAEYYFNISIQNTLHNKCKYTRKFSFSAFFKTMANFWRVTLKTAAPSEPPNDMSDSSVVSTFTKLEQFSIKQYKCFLLLFHIKWLQSFEIRMPRKTMIHTHV